LTSKSSNCASCRCPWSTYSACSISGLCFRVTSWKRTDGRTDCQTKIDIMDQLAVGSRNLGNGNLELWPCDLENEIFSSPKHSKYLCEFWFILIYRFTSCSQVHNISMVVATFELNYFSGVKFSRVGCLDSHARLQLFMCMCSGYDLLQPG